MSSDGIGHPEGVPDPRSDDGAFLAPLSSADLLEVLAVSRDRGFLGPGPVERHVEHAALMVRLCRGATSVLDLGSGGGVPGLLVAAALPQARVVLLDSMAKRCDFLREVGPLISGRIEVVEGRAEDLARRDDLRGAFDVVTARSFGPPSVVAECAVGFLSDAGRLVVSEPPGGAPDRWESGGLRRLGLADPLIEEDGTASAAVLMRSGPLDDMWPRRSGIPAKRPLWTAPA